MPGAVDVGGEEGAASLPPESRQRKRKGQGRGRKGKRICAGGRDQGGAGWSCEAGEGAGAVAAENGVLHGEGYGGVAVERGENGVPCAMDEVKMSVNGLEHSSVRLLDINASPGTAEEEGQSEESRGCGDPPNCTASLDLFGDTMTTLEPDTSCGDNQETGLRNGGDVGAHANGDASSNDGKDIPAEAPRKRRRHPLRETVTPEMPLRRSARRAATAALLSPSSDHFSSDNVPAEKHASEKGCSVEMTEENLVLPPSSKDLELDGLPVLDVFSVYACLRSFSTSLFLSPFSLKTFVAALKCNLTNSLIDSVHYSILQTLKPHIEVLSEEGSQSATDCLRNLNWELLDMVNWPLYLAEYLLVHHPAMSSGLKLLYGEYYEQPAAAKLEILRYLCDDVIEVEIIRSELDRRILESEVNVDTGQNVSIGSKGKDASMGERTTDGNSDECCLCRMDGSLICCDGCPAAFHPRCVGMASDILPEGEWFCPECLIGKVDRNIKPSKPFQGAEILGIDSHGRVYFGSCSYLLVSGSSNTDTSFHYYNKDDLNSVIEVLKTSYICHAGIISSISAHWCIPVLPPLSFLHIYQDGHGDYVDVACPLASEIVSPLKEELAEGENMVEKEWHMNSACRDYCQRSTVLESYKLDLAIASQLSGLTCADACSEGCSAVPMHVHGSTLLPMSCMTKAICSTDPPKASDIDLSSKCSEFMHEKHSDPPTSDHMLQASGKTNGATQVHLGLGDYVNCYSFGRIASSIAEELMRKSSDNITKDCKEPAEDIMSAQLRAIYKKSINCYWSAIQRLPMNAQKESCGWCFACKNPSEQECLFRMIENKVLVSSRNRAASLHSKDNKKSHILSVAHHILQIEDNIHGLLSGPWQSPHHKKWWRKNVFKAADITSLKHLLLTLELHLRRVALAAEWMKHVDSNIQVGSAFYVLTGERGGGRKHARKNISETKRISETGFCSLSNCTSTTDIYWWRGGRLSRQVFHWKMLPRSLASKGGRQAGCRKIPGVSYEGSEFAKRSKFVAWRAAVEMSQNVAQLTYHVKELDSNIRWNDLSNSQPLPQLAKESRKPSRPLWKATICEKCVEGAHVKYLIDFGKRKNIPDVVIKHGVLHKESSSEMKKYWLHESHVPINLLKTFEARKLEQMLKSTSLEMVSSEGSSCKTAKPRRERGLSHLFRGEVFDRNICGHCKTAVLEREEAVNCQYCEGLIHKKHFRVPKGAITTTYTCYACKDRKFFYESKEKKLQDGCKDKKFVSESKGRKPLDGCNGKKFLIRSEHKRLVDGCKDKKLVSDGKKKKHMDEDEKFLHEKDKRPVDGCKGKKLSGKRKGKTTVDGYQKKKSLDGRSRDKKFASEFKGRRLESRSKQRKPKLGKSKVVVIRKSERLAKKKQHGAKSKKRNVGRKKAKQSQTRKNEPVVYKKSEDDISWHKGRRTGMCPPYWLNGLLWTRKAYDEHAVHFRETRVLLPFSNSRNNLQPVCSLCHKEYDSHVIYVGCENCGDWFHGDAFALTLVNINNIRGFKCHRCCTKSTPVCPYLTGVVDEVSLLKDKNPSVNDIGDCDRLQCPVYDKQDLLQDHDYSDVVHSQKFLDEDQRAVAIPDSVQILILKDCNETASEVGYTEKGSHFLTEAEHPCVEYEVKVVGEDHPL